MSRSMVGLLAAVGVAMPALVPFLHGSLIVVAITDGAVAAGLAACLALPSTKKSPRCPLHI